MATFTPVDHDPFAVAPGQDVTTADVLRTMDGGGGARLTPVDHDPFAMDFNRPAAEVRLDISKLPAGEQRDTAMRQWADAAVARDRANEHANDIPGWKSSTPYIRDRMRDAIRGTLIGTFADEGSATVNDIIHKITGGLAGAPYEEVVEYERALNRAIAKEAPIASTATGLATGLVTGGVVAKGVYKAGKKVLPKVVAAPAAGVGVGGTAGYVAGLGEGDGDFAQRHDYATSGEGRPFGLSPTALGATVGLVAPPVIAGIAFGGNKLAEAAGPTLARYGAQMQELPRRMGFPASADGMVPEGVGPQAAAQQMLANSLRRSGKSVDDIRAAREQASDAGVYHTSGRAQDATFLADLDQGWQRLAGSAGRNNPGAAERGKNAIYARQTGLTPHNALAGDVAGSVGLPTAPMMARPITAPQAIQKFGTDFGAGTDNIVPMGQGARVVDALKRAFRIKDSDFHGHAANAGRTDDAILEAARAEAKPAYQSLYKDGQNIDVRPAITPVLDKWLRGDRLADEAAPVVAKVQRLIKLFEPNGDPVSSISRMDRTKQYIDGEIEKLLGSLVGKSTRVGGLLNDFKKEMLAAVDGIQTNNLGTRYKDARSKFSSAMEAREDIQAGRDAYKDPEAGLRSLAAYGDDKGRLKRFRLGILGEVEAKIGNMKSGADKTTVFDSANMQRLLSEAIPRTEGTGTFATRPERFGQYIGNAQREVETRNIFQGGSPTQRNIKDDDAYDVLSSWGEMIQGFKSTGSLTKLGIDLVSNTFQSMFGMRADTARALVGQLFTADRATQERILRGVAERMEPGQFERLTRYVQEQQLNLARSSAVQGAGDRQ